MDKRVFAALASMALCVLAAAGGTDAAERASGVLSAEEFRNPPQEVKLHTWWHWLDGAISRDGITKDLEAMKQQGVVQATILNIGLFDGRDFGVPQVKFNSPQWYEMFQWALQEANRLGISIGAHNCDGWSSSGGPWITPETSMKQYVWSKAIIKGGSELTVEFPQPYSERGFYRDVAVIAYPAAAAGSSFQSAAAKVTINDGDETKWLTDGNPVSAQAVKNGDKVRIAFAEPFRAEKIVIHPRKRFLWGSMDSFRSHFTLWASDDGKDFKKVKDVELTGLNRSVSVEIPATTAKVYRLDVGEISNIDSYMAFNVAEVELLKKGESPLYNPSILYHLEKTVSVKAARAEYFNIAGKTDQPAISPDSIIELTSKMSREGELKWNAPPGDWVIIRFGYTTTGAENGPATKEGRGLECDKMDAAAVDLHFRSYPQKLAEAAGKYAGNTFKFLLIDSWECGYQNWTESFADEFEKRRHYRLAWGLPALCGDIVGSAGQSEAFLYDFRKTIAELIEENYYRRFSELCHKAGIEMHAEIIYGGTGYPPLDVLKSNSYADLHMFEFWSGHNGKTSLTEYTPVERPETIFPAYASTCYDKSVLGAESYTAMAHYSESPWDLKPFGDRAYCGGVNQFILHSYVHQPNDRKPGMTLGTFASHFNRNNLYWQHFSGWSSYHARIQYVLQKGLRQDQVLHFIGDQLPQDLERTKAYALPVGYSEAYCNFDVLVNRIKVSGGQLEMTNGLRYSVLSIPDAAAMELATLERLAELINDGAVVYGPRPTGVMSLRGTVDKEEAALRILADKVWGKVDGKTVTENQYGQGRVIWGKPIADVLKEKKVLPAFETNTREANTFLYIHKKVKGDDVFFVANQLDTKVTRELLFATSNKTPEIWDAESGEVTRPAMYTAEDGRLRLPVVFRPRQSLLFVFKGGDGVNHLTSASMGGKQVFPQSAASEIRFKVPEAVFSGSSVELTSEQKGTYTFATSSRKEFSAEIKEPESYPIDGFKGTLSFVPGYDADIRPVEITGLKSLTEFDDPAMKYFSGTATYTIRFATPAAVNVKTDVVFLCMGSIGSTAQVSLNGRELGCVWRASPKLDVTGLLNRDSENVLEVKVANVYRNRFIGDYIQFGKPQDIWTSAPVETYLDKNKPLKPSGLIGPMKLLKANVLKIDSI